MAVSITLNRARANINEAGVSLAVLATLANLRPTTLSSVYRGVMALDPVKEARLMTISFRLLELQQALAPFDLPKEAGDAGRLLAQLEDGCITLDEVRGMVARMIGTQQFNSSNAVKIRLLTPIVRTRVVTRDVAGER